MKLSKYLEKKICHQSRFSATEQNMLSTNRILLLCDVNTTVNVVKCYKDHFVAIKYIEPP